MFAPTEKTGDIAAYEAAKADLDHSIVARFARGNVRVQNGNYLDSDDLAEMVRTAEADLARLDDLLRAA